jgi:hypothetical protein
MAAWYETGVNLSNSSRLIVLGSTLTGSTRHVSLRAGSASANGTVAASQSGNVTSTSTGSPLVRQSLSRRPYHAAAVFAAANSQRAYLNGVPSAINAANVPVDITSLTTTCLGCEFLTNAFTSLSFVGRAWWFALWAVALTNMEVRDLAMGRCPLYVRRNALRVFVPGEGDYRDYASGITFTPASTNSFFRTPAFPKIRYLGTEAMFSGFLPVTTWRPQTICY